jgi:hypothetical protein
MVCNEELNAELYQLVKEVLKHPQGSAEWRKRISAIHRKIQNSEELPQHACEDRDYQEALEKTQRWFPRNLEQFCQQASSNPNLTVIQWYKNYLIDCLLAQFSKPGRLYDRQKLNIEGTEIYPQALLETQKWFAKNLHRYNPARSKDSDEASLLGWFGQTLSYKIKYPDLPIDPIRPLPDTVRVKPEVGQPEGDQESIWDVYPLTSDNSYEDIQRRERIAALRACVQQCDMLNNMHVPQRRDITCRDLLLLRLPDPDGNPPRWFEYSWKELEQEFGVPSRQLINCFNRHLRNSRCRAYLRNCLCQSLKDSDLT